jgi:hypothetical protein
MFNFKKQTFHLNATCLQVSKRPLTINPLVLGVGFELCDEYIELMKRRFQGHECDLDVKVAA